MDDGFSFGHWLKVRRVVLLLTQAELAKRIGYSTVTVRKLESDDLRPSRQIAERLAAHLELAPENRLDFIRFAQGAAAAEKLSPFISYSGRQLSSKIAHHSSTQLPIPLTPLVGREEDVMTVERLLLRTNVRLVSLTGAGGIGKTRLGLEVAHVVREHFPDGVYFVDLAPIVETGLVAATIASTIGLRETGGQSLLETLKYFLREKRLLLFLDNFEQVISAASIVAELLAACPQFNVLVTSREPLHVRGEKEYPVGSLMLPERLKDERQPTDGASRLEVTQYAAVELFVQRASDVKPNFIVTDENARVVAEICVRLGGLPLAIELAAARMNVLSPEAIQARLAGTSGHAASSLRLLTGGARDLPARQRTLRNTIAWSYDLLNDNEQQLFRRLSVFVGGCTLDAAEAVCNVAGDLNVDVLDGVASLVDKNLLRQVEGKAGEPRFTMLETIREYALERLEASGEAEALRGQHTEYYLALAETAEPELHRAEQLLWLQRLEHELDNLRAALAWSQTSAGDAETGLRLAGALGPFWHMRSHWSEGRMWLIRILANPIAKATAARAKALNWAGFLVDSKSQQEALFEESLAIGRALGDATSVADALRGLGIITEIEAAPERTHALFEESLVLCQELGDTWRSAMALFRLGRLAYIQGDFGGAIARYEESLALFRQLGDRWDSVGPINGLLWARMNSTQSYNELTSDLTEILAQARQLGEKGACANILNGLGELARSQGEYGRAAIYYAESLALWQELGNRSEFACVRSNQGLLAHNQGDEDLAAALLMEGLVLVRETGDQITIAYCLAGLGWVAMGQGWAERAARLLGAAKAPFEATGSLTQPVDRAEFDRNATAARAALGEDAFAAAWTAGQALTLDQAIAYALGEDA
jgi:predicted ATPase/transcriptional regulator with XRE-family HTH domain